jgi:signal transduction histidine kinase
MVSRFQESFPAKIFCAITLFIVTVSLAFSAFFIVQQQRSNNDKLLMEGKLLARMLAYNSRLAVFSENRAMLNLAAEGVLGSDNVLTVAIFDHEGRLLAETIKQPKNSPARDAVKADREKAVGLPPSLQISTLIQKETSVEFITPVLSKAYASLEGPLFFVEKPAQVGDRVIGFVKIALDKTMLKEELRRNLLIAALATSAFLLIGILLAYLVARGIARPLNHLTEGIRLLEMGNLDTEIPIETKDEIGRLAGAFNRMVDALKQRREERKAAQKEIRELNRDLEQRVAQRTAALEFSNKELESFNYSVAHDLSAPLARLKGFCRALQEDYGDRLEEQGHFYIQRLCMVGQQMDDVIIAMKAVYRVRHYEICRTEIYLSEIAAEVIATLREAEPERQVTVLLEPGLTVNGDAHTLRLVLENLLGNAWKFTGREPDALIEFGASQKGNEMVYFVRDNGAGFDMQDADKLFKPFQRLHTADCFPGTGVGLTIVQKIVNLFNGAVWLESAEGKGTTSYFTLN